MTIEAAGKLGITKYKIIRKEHHALRSFANEIVSHVQSGWELHGAPFHSVDDSKYNHINQAMVKHGEVTHELT